jgi:hypothetical protein
MHLERRTQVFFVPSRVRYPQQWINRIPAPPMNQPARRAQQPAAQSRIRKLRNLPRYQSVAPLLQKI